MSPQDDGWIDEDPGTVARPYMVTGGRTRPVGESNFDLIDIVAATGSEPRRGFTPAHEHARILELCQRPLAVAELSAGLGLPIGVVRVLLGDLLYEELIEIHRQTQRLASRRLLQQVLDGLNAM